MKDSPSANYLSKLFPPIFALNSFDVLNFTEIGIDNSEHPRQQLSSLKRSLWAAVSEANSLDGVLNKKRQPKSTGLFESFSLGSFPGSN